MKWTIIAFASAAATLGVAQGEPAQTQAQQTSKAIASMDANGDGSISRDEVHAARERVFDRVDADHNGRITDGERRASHLNFGSDNTPGGVNRDISRNEFVNAPYTLFERTDTNRDGLASADEIRSARNRHVEDADYF